MEKTNSFCLKYLFSVLILFLFFNETYSQNIGTNYRIHPSGSTQTEVFITVHPLDPSTMFVSANTIIFQPTYFVSEGVYVTTNAGSSWYGNDTCSGANINFHGGDPGIAIDKDGRFILTRKARSPLQGLYSHYSTDQGISWSTQYQITDEYLERAAVTTDGDPQSPFYGRTYAAWEIFSPPFPIFLAHTTNGAISWTSPLQINNPAQRSYGAEVEVSINGKVYVCWAGLDASAVETHVGFAFSTDGGGSWTVDENVFETQGIRGTLPEKQNIRVDGLPRMEVDRTEGFRQGWIYIVTTQKNLSPAGSDPDIIFNRSTDGGLTWSSAVKVNQDAINNGKIQYFPAIHVDNSGGINIIFYDDRNTTSDSAGVFLARSVDGGDTWTEYEISDHNFKPAAIGGLGQGYQGDNIGIISSDNILWPVWMDNSTGIYQIWTVPIDLKTLAAEETEYTPDMFKLYQNYPNPFNPSTRIQYAIESRQFVSLKVFDVLGNEVAVLVNEDKSAGNYEAAFDASKLSSGIYFYKLSAGTFIETKKMVIIK